MNRLKRRHILSDVGVRGRDGLSDELIDLGRETFRKEFSVGALPRMKLPPQAGQELLQITFEPPNFLGRAPIAGARAADEFQRGADALPEALSRLVDALEKDTVAVLGQSFQDARKRRDTGLLRSSSSLPFAGCSARSDTNCSRSCCRTSCAPASRASPKCSLHGLTASELVSFSRARASLATRSSFATATISLTGSAAGSSAACMSRPKKTLFRKRSALSVVTPDFSTTSMMALVLRLRTQSCVISR